MSRIYLASPYGFSESTVGFLEELKVKLRNAGHDLSDPWERALMLQDVENYLQEIV